MGVVKKLHFHVCRLHPNTEADFLKEYLIKNNIVNAEVTKLNSKFPDVYSSFKISVGENLKESILKPDLWPSGVLINRFFWNPSKVDDRPPSENQSDEKAQDFPKP
uniref:Uncharacterized protein n=2 Tax=Photinus pyralis TaxID=7054 RepID=A0A1Y1LPE0_PHOPY